MGMSCGIGSERQLILARLCSQLIEHYAWLYAGGLLNRIERTNRPHIFGSVDRDRNVNRLAGEARFHPLETRSAH